MTSRTLNNNPFDSYMLPALIRGINFLEKSIEIVKVTKSVIMGKGKDLFGHFNDLAKEKGPGTKESDYAGILFQALLMVGERRTFELLEEADELGKKLKLQYPDTSKKNAAPSGIVLV